jgi:hypothetical protein
MLLEMRRIRRPLARGGNEEDSFDGIADGDQLGNRRVSRFVVTIGWAGREPPAKR